MFAHYDNEDVEEVGVEVQLNGLEDEEWDVIDISAPWDGGWTKDLLIKAFNIDPDSPIWEVGGA